MKKIIFLLATALFLSVACCGQIATGGSYALDKSVIAGGGETSTGGGFSLTGTIGQSAAGTTSTGDAFSLTSGFWQPDVVSSPTAARVTVSGNVVSNANRPIRMAIVTFTGADGIAHSALTNNFGVFAVPDLEAGQTYMVTVSARLYTFVPQALMVGDSISDLKIRAL